MSKYEVIKILEKYSNQNNRLTSKKITELLQNEGRLISLIAVQQNLLKLRNQKLINNVLEKSKINHGTYEYEYWFKK